MAITDAEKLDHLWKHFQGLAKTASAGAKTASNETIPSPVIVFPEGIWNEASAITPTPPAVSNDAIQVRTGMGRVRMTSDPTSPPNVAWLASAVFGEPGSRMDSFIPAAFGAPYAVKVYIGDPHVGPAARIFPDTTNEEWVFNYASGVLTFPNNVPANKTATIGSGSVSVASAGIYIEAYRYIGAKGGGGSGGGGVTPDDLGTMAYQNADAVLITGGVIRNTTIDGGEF